MDGEQKQARSMKFSRHEMERLISLVEMKKYVVESRDCASTSSEEKKQAWDDIETAFNYFQKGEYRTTRTLQYKYNTMKRNIRRKYKENPNPLNLTPLEYRLRDILGIGDGDTNDSDLHNNSEPALSSPRLDSECEVNTSDLPHNLNEEIKIEDDDVTETYSNNELLVERSSKPLNSETDEPPQKKLCVDTKLQQSPTEPPMQDQTNANQIPPSVNIKGPIQNSIELRRKIMEEELQQKLIQTQLVRDELEFKRQMQVLQRKLCVEELEHKKMMHDLEKQHLQLKIKKAKLDLELAKESK